MGVIYGTIPGPQINNVYVGAISPGSGTLWSSGVLSLMSPTSLGYKIPVGVISSSGSRTIPGQLDTLPWTNINCISIAFSEDVNVNINSLSISGVLETYNIYNFSYALNNGEYTASWFFSQSNPPFSRDKIRIILTGSSVRSKKTNSLLAGQIINASWNVSGDSTTSNGTTLPNRSANNSNFNLRLNILPGDVNNSNLVDSIDSTDISSGLGATVGAGNYSLYADLNLNGSITNQDLSFRTSFNGTSLPTGSI
jgi:hypothetical protein